MWRGELPAYFGGSMVNFERAFEDLTSSCDAAVKASRALTSQLGQLKKASETGNINTVKRLQSSIVATLDELAAPVKEAANAWPYDDDTEVEYMRDGYAAELRSVASDNSLNIVERDGRLISYPSIVSILPPEKAVRIDKKLVRTIRPSHLVGELVKAQRKPPRTNPQGFLNTLYREYQDLASDSSSRMIGGGSAPVILLARIYDHITAMSWVKREYSRTDFARDLYQLDKSGVKSARSGAVVSFPASTGARSARNLFTFVGPDGHEAKYYGIRFTES